jgi:hypothetical protein
MNAQKHLEGRLRGIKDVPIRLEGDLSRFISARIMSKKFRKYSVAPEAHDKVRTAIGMCIQNEEPIKIALPYGSYKLWRLEESPEPDWAELFAMIYYAYWLKPITDVYEPGVWFEFCGDDAILELMNNTPESDTVQYKSIFRELLKFIEQYLPENFKYTFSPVGERYVSKEEFLADLKDKVGELRKNGEIELSERDIEMMKFNVRPRDGEEIDFQRNRLIHDAYMAVSKRRVHHKRPDKILISATPFGARTSIPVGTTKSSVVKFQTGTGVLKRYGDSFLEYIYSPSQLEDAQYQWEETDINGLEGKNFSKVRVVA